ncbi:protein HEATR9 isoform X2 [Nycticebus coucang]|uniref:protein HEATR9 isoform X2 n=1 Tax=Nycticebus coucang TaxID=9470 RepID=UPI00234D7967|nr:protein HEATR9 isoform X2 [Nycticebus coucang]
MDCEKSVNILDTSGSMFAYPWLEYQKNTKELRKATTPVYLPLFYYQMPKKELPPSPECWRQYPGKPNAVPYCYFNKPEVYTHWRILYDQREERVAQKMLRKMRDHSRYVLPELTKSLNSPTEDEQLYAAQALGCLGISDNFVMEALWQVAHTGPEKVKYEAYRSLAILGCLNKHVIRYLIKQLKEQNEDQKLETLVGLRMALNSWAALPTDKRSQVGYEEKLVPELQMLIKKSSHEIALEAALCLGFLRPYSDMAREFLLQCLCQGLKKQQMKALRMLVKKMHVHSASVIKATLDQLCSSSVLEDRSEATQMLRTIGLEQIQAQGLEELTFDLLKKKTHNEPFLVVRRAVAETVEELKMRPMMMNMVEAQLTNPDPIVRKEAVTSLGVLGIHRSHVFHLLLDMLDSEDHQDVKKSLQETLILCASTDPWIQRKLKNKVFLVCEATETPVKAEPTKICQKTDNLEELNIQDFRLAKLNPLFIAKSSPNEDEKKKLYAFPPLLCSTPQKHRSQATGPWQLKLSQEFQILTDNAK